MSLWHFMAAISGYGKANGWNPSAGGKPMSMDRMRELGIMGA